MLLTQTTALAMMKLSLVLLCVAAVATATASDQLKEQQHQHELVKWNTHVLAVFLNGSSYTKSPSKDVDALADNVAALLDSVHGGHQFEGGNLFRR